MQNAGGHATIHDAASSLQSLQSGIQYEPFAAETISRQEVDTASNGSVDDVEQLDFTGEDVDAMEALLALTSDCSVQSPPHSQNPAGKGFLKPILHIFDLEEHIGTYLGACLP